jgi:rhombotail lipoprotein
VTTASLIVAPPSTKERNMPESNARVVALLLLPLLLTGCAFLDPMLCWPNCRAHATHVDASSSLVQFLYPNGSAPPPANSVPVLQLPLRVGLAFLPPRVGSSGPSPAQREQLLQMISQRFAQRPFVRAIQTIPDMYLLPGQHDLAALQRLLNVDLIALVSYDQSVGQTARDNSWTWLTIVGALVVDGAREDFSTLVDLAVIEPASRSLMLRAGGTDQRTKNSTLVGVGQDMRSAASESYALATARLIDNFDTALTQFESDVKQQRAPVAVHWQGGGGAVDLLTLMFAGVAAVCVIGRRIARRVGNRALYCRS